MSGERRAIFCISVFIVHNLKNFDINISSFSSSFSSSFFFFLFPPLLFFSSGGAELRSNLNNVFWRHHPANFDVQVKGIFTDNVAAGSERVGFKGWGSPCLSSSDPNWKWDRNEAHSTMIGTASLGSCPATELCYSNFKGWYNWNFGMWGSVTCSIHVKNAQLSDNTIAVHYGIGGPDSLAFRYGDMRFSLKYSTLVGTSDPSKCKVHRDEFCPPKKDKWAWSNGRGRTGLMLATFSREPNMLIPFKKPWVKTQSAYQALWGRATVSSTSFYKFGSNDCNMQSQAIESNPMASDGQHPHHFQTLTFDSESQTSLVKFHKPSEGWIVLDDCVSMVSASFFFLQFFFSFFLFLNFVFSKQFFLILCTLFF